MVLCSLGLGYCEPEDMMGKYPQVDMVTALLQSVLAEAAYEGRLVKGLRNCTKVLDSDPDKLMICVLPESSSCSNVTLDIKTILIESICLECGIPVVRVDAKQIQLRCHSLEKKLKDLKSDWQHEDESSPILQLDCFFIQKRDGDPGESEKSLMCLLQNPNDDKHREFPK